MALPHQSALWTCLEIMEQEELQAATIESLSLGPQSAQAARPMLWSLFSCLQPRAIIETGTSHGLTSAFLWCLGDQLGVRPEIWTFDLAQSTLAPRLWSQIGAERQIHFFRGDSSRLIATHCRPPVDFALIDGDHSYAGAERDWRAIEPMLQQRSAVYLDNMDHSDGCGRFFAELSPLWFHPSMAVLVRGLDGGELQSIFRRYVDTQLSAWLAASAAAEGDRLRAVLRTLLGLLQVPLSPSARIEVAAACREASHLAAASVSLPLSVLRRLSAAHNIGSREAACRERLLELLPVAARRWVERAYHALKPSK